MDLISWIIIGIVINIALLKNELLSKKETILAGFIIIIVRSISGGVLSNYIFSEGIGRMDFATFTITGLVPLVILFIANIIEKLDGKNLHTRRKTLLIS